MDSQISNIAVILAGGVGKRFDENRPKQLVKVAGKSIIEHTIDIFEKSEEINEIAIVAHNSLKQNIEDIILKNKWNKVKKVLNGGKERYDSTLSAIKAYENYPDDTKMLFHDAVRPLLNPEIIEAVITKLDTYDAVDVAIPSSDTIVKVTPDKKEITDIPDRKYLYRGQTPQAFKLGIIKHAYSRAMNDPQLVATDDCGIVAKYLPDTKIAIVSGEEKNIKLTYQEDIYLLDKLFQINSHILRSSGLCIDNLKDKVIVVFGGNSGIGADIINIGKKYGAKSYSFSRSSSGIDISNNFDVKKALKDVYIKEGRIDYVIDTAAILRKEPLMSMTKENIRNIIETNYYGVVNIAMESYPYLKESKGQILFFTSSSYTRGRAFYSLYSSTKAAVVNFVQAISEEWEPDKIHVNCINPERTLTPMRQRNFGIEDASTLLESNDVALIALSTLLSNINGQVIDVKVSDYIKK